ncbi:tRNA (adenosine(37)-N6)-dimethylallyltransferase MiaA [Pedomonas mirosovicensis]|uniref:tRNA (adenosine(37)-N6)-dimethylallyltransferase MiaA n=1 Tax=Pedomonas mirosovicensis TaxID=2908641 RepID=UPI0021695349|nr:tRNA (adenosine(37)-N6)-dimethylallyltransferase MiaA [Pedomonas mirosovicensis]MCH8684887.1 tRNA (adenosine(37)-N6)-dimethylallyltransferase MiaA [Pedomonas mirosovicensis]
MATNIDMSNLSRKPLVLIAGPTASGKSAVSLWLAETAPGTVINGDALQLYRDLSVLTARPSPEDEARAPHRLYGVLDGGQASSAAWWAEQAIQAVETAWGEGRLPIITGGTGLYLRTLLHGIVPVPDIDEAVRADVRARMERQGPETLHAELSRLDPVTAARLGPRDRQRIARALEVVLATGTPLSQYQAETTGGLADRPDVGPVARCVILPDREILYARCDQRLETMVELGALEEVRKLLARNLAPEMPVMKAVGVPEFVALLEKRMDYQEAIESAQRATRQYAKRQYTWFRNQCRDWHFIRSHNLEIQKEQIATILRDIGLTLKV